MVLLLMDTGLLLALFCEPFDPASLLLTSPSPFSDCNYSLPLVSKHLLHHYYTDDAPRKKAVPRRKPNPAPKKKQRAPPAKRKKPPAKKSVASADTGNSESSSSSSDDDAPRKKPIPRRNNGKQPAKAIAKGRSPGKSKEQTADADASTADSAKTESAKEDEFLLSEDPEKNREALVQSLDNRGVIANRTKSAGKAKDGVGAADKGMSLTKRQTRIVSSSSLLSLLFSLSFHLINLLLPSQIRPPNFPGLVFSLFPICRLRKPLKSAILTRTTRLTEMNSETLWLRLG